MLRRYRQAEVRRAAQRRRGESFAREVYAARYGREISTALLWATLLLLIAELAVRGSFVPPRVFMRTAPRPGRSEAA